MQNFIEYLYCCFESKPRYSNSKDLKFSFSNSDRVKISSYSNGQHLFRYPKNKYSKNKIYFWKSSMDKQDKQKINNN